MDISILRRLRFIEGLMANLPLLIVFLLFEAPFYLGVSVRITFNVVLILFLCAIKFRQGLGNLLYVRIFPFMKPLWEYEQQKFISDKWIKWRRNRRYFNAFVIIITWLFIMLYPSPMPRQINWYTLIGSLVGFNIGMVIYVLGEEFYY
ncbi:MAG TPA: hypothetical protein VIM51_08245 [Desulfosporosinus sp.]